MDKLKNIKYFSGAAFIVAFIMAIVVFTGYGSSIISTTHARTVFIIAGAIAFFLNAISYQQGKNAPTYNLFFWGSSILLFIGLIFKFLHYPYATVIIYAGLIALGISFFLPSKRIEGDGKDEELLDNF